MKSFTDDEADTSHSAARCVTLAALLMLPTVLLSTSAPLHAQQSRLLIENGKMTNSVVATSVATSESRITGRLSPPGGQPFDFMIKEGGMLRIQDDTTGVNTAFVATQTDGIVVFHEFLIEAHPSGGGEAMAATGNVLQFDLADDELKVQQVSNDGYALELRSFVPEKQTRSEVGFNKPLFPVAPPIWTKGQCCISCSGFTVCACAVSACGASCCAGSCCGGGGCGRPECEPQTQDP